MTYYFIKRAVKGDTMHDTTEPKSKPRAAASLIEWASSIAPLPRRFRSLTAFPTTIRRK